MVKFKVLKCCATLNGFVVSWYVSQYPIVQCLESVSAAHCPLYHSQSQSILKYVGYGYTHTHAHPQTRNGLMASFQFTLTILGYKKFRVHKF